MLSTEYISNAAASRSPAAFRTIGPSAPEYSSSTPGIADTIAPVSAEPASSIDSPITQTASYAGIAYITGVLPLTSDARRTTSSYTGFGAKTKIGTIRPASSTSFCTAGSFENLSLFTTASVPYHSTSERDSCCDADCMMSAISPNASAATATLPAPTSSTLASTRPASTATSVENSVVPGLYLTPSSMTPPVAAISDFRELIIPSPQASSLHMGTRLVTPISFKYLAIASDSYGPLGTKRNTLSPAIARDWAPDA